MRFGIFSSQQGSHLKKLPSQPICKGLCFNYEHAICISVIDYAYTLRFFKPSCNTVNFLISSVSFNTFRCGPSLVFNLVVSLSLLLPGPTVSNHNQNDKPKFRAKSSIRSTPRSSTLMRPTASQLAKQNNARWLL